MPNYSDLSRDELERKLVNMTSYSISLEESGLKLLADVEKLREALKNMTASARTFRNVPKGEQEWTPDDDVALVEAFDVLDQTAHWEEG